MRYLWRSLLESISLRIGNEECVHECASLSTVQALQVDEKCVTTAKIRENAQIKCVVVWQT